MKIKREEEERKKRKLRKLKKIKKLGVGNEKRCNGDSYHALFKPKVYNSTIQTFCRPTI